MFDHGQTMPSRWAHGLVHALPLHFFLDILFAILSTRSRGYGSPPPEPDRRHWTASPSNAHCAAHCLAGMSWQGEKRPAAHIWTPDTNHKLPWNFRLIALPWMKSHGQSSGQSTDHDATYLHTKQPLTTDRANRTGKGLGFGIPPGRWMPIRTTTDDGHEGPTNRSNKWYGLGAG